MKEQVFLESPLCQIQLLYHATRPVSYRSQQELDLLKQAHETLKEETQTKLQENESVFLQRGQEVLKGIQSEYQKYKETFIEQVPHLLLALFERLYPQIELTSETIKHRIEGLIEQLGLKEEALDVQVSAKDFQVLKPLFSQNSYVNLVLSTELDSGECRIQSRFGIVDATTESQLKKIKEVLYD